MGLSSRITNKLKGSALLARLKVAKKKNLEKSLPGKVYLEQHFIIHYSFDHSSSFPAPYDTKL